MDAGIPPYWSMGGRPKKKYNFMNCNYQFSITNIPNYFNRRMLQNFVIDTVNSDHVTQNIIHNPIAFKQKFPLTVPRVWIVSFSNNEAAEEAYEILKGVELQGKKLFPEWLSGKNDPANPDSQRFIKVQSIQSQFNKWDVKPKFFEENFTKETYGLSFQFLHQLDIHLPLYPSVVVSNLPDFIEKKDILKIFSYAGKILTLFIKRKKQNEPMNSALILYDHPVEAVQAIAMFHDQYLYENRLIVRKNSCLKSLMYQMRPSSLKSVGPGLGESGQPLRCVSVHIAIEEIKQMMRDWLAKMSSTNQNLNISNIFSGIFQKELQSDLFKGLAKDSRVVRNVQATLPTPAQQVNTGNVLNIQNSLQNILAVISNSGNGQANQSLPLPIPTPVNVPQTRTQPEFSLKSPRLRTQRCFKCQQYGHQSRQCPQHNIY